MQEKLSKKCEVCSVIFYKPYRYGDKLWAERRFCGHICSGISRRGQLPKNFKIFNPGRKGKDNFNWKGGVTSENYRLRRSNEFLNWRKLVYERDEYKCQNCFEHSRELRPHHILNFETHKELRFMVDNGITLCHRCHKDFHDTYGYKNNTREQINEYIKGGRRTFSHAIFKRIFNRLQYSNKLGLCSELVS